MVSQAEERSKIRKQQTEMAIQLALQGRWAEAVKVNRAIIEAFPTDVDAYNRLGKALTELGRYAEAREAYTKALELSPHNTIARKNLSRLAMLGEEEAPRPASQKLSPQMFIEEMGKTGVTTLVRPRMEAVARMTAGDRVHLERTDGSLIVRSTQGEYIGEIEPRLAQRLIKLMEGGNQYEAAISALSEDDIKVFIRETYQHPTQAGKLSFPPTVTETFRPYVKERLLRQDADEELYYDEAEEGEEWEAGGEGGPDVAPRRFGVGAAEGEDEEEE